MDLIGVFSFPNMIRSILEGDPEVNRVSDDEHNVQAYAKMYNQLLDYDLSLGSDLSGESELAVISKGICRNFYKPSWGGSKRHLLNANIRKTVSVNSRKRANKIIKANLRMGECSGVAKIAISITFDELAGMVL